MHLVHEIFKLLDGPTAVANSMGVPVQTAHSWKAKGSIPLWRRPAFLELARRKGRQFPPELLSYLAAPAEAD